MLPLAACQSEEEHESSQKYGYPARLFDICINLVSENLDLVESFQGFPSLVGEKIFQAALSTAKIRDVDYANQSVKLFAEAFGSEFLSSLNVTGEHLGLNYYIDGIFMFEDLVHLDVSNCGLGDDHELFTHLSKLKRLESIYLCSNNLTDRGVQKLTLTYRMFGQGPENLYLLNLSGNTELTKGCLKYLKPYPTLDRILFFNCHLIEIGMHSDWSIQEDKSVSVPAIHTLGWAGTLVTRWMKDARERVSKQALKKKTSFYSRPAVATSHETSYPSQDSKHCPKICLVAYRNRPFQRTDIVSTKINQIYCSKDEDNDLLDMYGPTSLTDQQPPEKANLLTGLTHFETNKEHIGKCNKTSLSGRLKFGVPSKCTHRTQMGSKSGQTGLLGLATSPCVPKNVKSSSKAIKHSTVLNYFTREGRQKSKENKKPVVENKNFTRINTHSVKYSTSLKNETVTSSTLSGANKLIIKKRQVTYDSAGKDEQLAAGPARKKRKIIIQKPHSEISNSNEVVDRKERSEKNKLNTKLSTGSSLLDAFNKCF